jgi:CheY-like chemotaxis protein
MEVSMKDFSELPEAGRNPARALVVDDDFQMRQFVRTTLEAEGFVVLDAAEGREALRRFSSEGADVVVTDIFMPEDGLVLITELRKLAPDLPVVAVSGGDRRGDTHALRAARLLGATAVLYKPFAPAALVSAVRSALGKAGG